ncbi:SIMPL domain-containing protein [Phenylobacterium sp.]|jgi:uncharacterized protein YggE|uniref:SIMPL domain-containing protein n=1 Tax=Phenylobacterium sp. TaxID=1871053 RepID=UPI003783F4CD
MRSLPVALVAAALFCAAAPQALAQAAPPAADTMFQATTLNLAAYGETDVQPDKATITLGVATEGQTAAAAMQANADQMSRVVAALRRAGLAERDIQTSSLNLSPQYHHQENQPPRLTGYQASNLVTITVRDLKRLGAAIDATVGAGANQMHGISFGLQDPTAAENAAREQAVKALAAKAELYARATGHRISRLVSLSEGSASYPRPPMPMMMDMAMSARKAETSVSAGELTVRVDVTGLYELSR